MVAPCPPWIPCYARQHGLDGGNGSGTRAWNGADGGSPAQRVLGRSLSFFEDLDLDGAPDIVITGPSGIYVAWNQGGGEFEAYEADIYCTTTEDDLMPAASPLVAFADLDGDGETDVTVAESSDDELVFMVGRQQDDHLRRYARLPAGEVEPLAVLAGDFDGEGLADLAVLHDHPGSLDGPFPLLVHLNATP